MERHFRQGDGLSVVGPEMPTIPPHAKCEFCKRHFYCHEDLLEHMHKVHHLCGLCERQGREGEFFKDYGYLSKHYEEQHWVCKHDSCRRGPYTLVAFQTEDELCVHEATQHSSGLSASKAKKQGVRLNLQVGSASYRDDPERARRGQGQGGKGGKGVAGDWDRRNVVSLPDGTLPIRFAWSRAQPDKVDRRIDDLGPNDRKEQKEAEWERYPPRPVQSYVAPAAYNIQSQAAPTRPQASRRAVPEAEIPVQEPEPPAAPASSSSSSWRRRNRAPAAEDSAKAEDGGDVSAASITPAPTTTADRSSAARRRPEPDLITPQAKLLLQAVSSISESGIDVASSYDRAVWKSRNKQFQQDLGAALGQQQMTDFKEHSAKFRRTLADAGNSSASAKEAAVRTYAEKVVEVFLDACRGKQQEARAAGLLTDLVLLLPDPVLRHLLHSQLQQLAEMSTS
eukprot:TRINITY_DN34312_c1_g1_i2.p1 TRINITY_DN34312_c1_g1~~TRINITY_DN34312_c1_g1_i2.p1  ORF type:complete len:452 (+),score=84.87 TRINITY_DN34312_c1_g1_i2:811-2166(+)